jgi:signal transduction histidine kinase
MTPAELRVAIDGAAEAEPLRRVVQECAALLRASNDADRFGLADTLLPLLAHPSAKVRRAMADACDAFPGDLFEEAFERLAADPDHYVCAAARRAGERKSARRFATQKSDAADRLTAEVAAAIERDFGKEARRLATRLAKREVEQYVERMTHESTKLDNAIEATLDTLDAELGKPGPSVAALRTLSGTLRARILLQRALVRRAREYARAIRPVFASESVASMVDEARTHLVARLGVRAGRLVFGADVPPSLSLHADRHALLQALQNLLQNAVESYAAAAESLEVRVTGRAIKKGTAIELRIEDRGVGMSAEAKANLLIPFRTTKPGGTGVGFLMARKMVEEVHGGSLAVESVEGTGTTLILTLPARQAGVKDRP